MYVRKQSHEQGVYVKNNQIWRLNMFTMVPIEVCNIVRRLSREEKDVHYYTPNILVIDENYNGDILGCLIAGRKGEGEIPLPGEICIPYEAFNLVPGVYISHEDRVNEIQTSKEDYLKYYRLYACTDKLLHIKDVLHPSNFDPHPLDKCYGEISQEFMNVVRENIADFKPINS